MSVNQADMSDNIKSKKKFDFAMLAAIFTLAWPTMLEELMQTAVQYIDTAMVGALGTQATAAVGATGTVNWLVGSTVSAIGVGFLAYISQSVGSKNMENARHAAAQAVMSVFVIGSLFTAVTLLCSPYVPVWMQVDESIRDMASRYFFILYTPMLFRASSIILGTVLRAAGDTKTPMKIGIAVNSMNVIFNFLLIYPTRELNIFSRSFTIPGAGLGIEGAALASAAAYAFGGIAIFVKVWTHPVISPRGWSVLPDWNVLRPCFRVALPNMFQRFATSFGYVAFASMINSIGETATAAHTIANTVESLFYIPGYGMQSASATLAGNAVGAKDNRKLHQLTKTILPLEIALMTVSGGLLFIFAPQLMQLFSKDSQVIALGSTVLRMVAVSEPFYGVPIVLEGIMQGMGRTVPPFVYNILGMWCVRIAGTFVCTQILSLGLVSAWACMIGHNLLLFVLFTVHFALTNKKIHINNSESL